MMFSRVRECSFGAGPGFLAGRLSTDESVLVTLVQNTGVGSRVDVPHLNIPAMYTVEKRGPLVSVRTAARHLKRGDAGNWAYCSYTQFYLTAFDTSTLKHIACVRLWAKDVRLGATGSLAVSVGHTHVSIYDMHDNGRCVIRWWGSSKERRFAIHDTRSLAMCWDKPDEVQCLLWDRARGGRTLVLVGHDASPTDCDLGADFIVTASMDSTARVWDLAFGVCRYKVVLPTLCLRTCEVAGGCIALSSVADSWIWTPWVQHLPHASAWVWTPGTPDTPVTQLHALPGAMMADTFARVEDHVRLAAQPTSCTSLTAWYFHEGGFEVYVSGTRVPTFRNALHDTGLRGRRVGMRVSERVLGTSWDDCICLTDLITSQSVSVRIPGIFAGFWFSDDARWIVVAAADGGLALYERQQTDVAILLVTAQARRRRAGAPPPEVMVRMLAPAKQKQAAAYLASRLERMASVPGVTRVTCVLA